MAGPMGAVSTWRARSSAHPQVRAGSAADLGSCGIFGQVLTSTTGPFSATFTVREALDSGLTKSQLRSKRFVSQFRGVYTSAHAEADLRTRCAAATRILPAVAVFSHSTAAALCELPVPPLDGALEVCVPAGTSVPQIRGIKAHERKALDDDVVTISGLRVTNAVTLFIDLAERLDHMQLMALGDAVLRKRLAARTDLEHAANRATRRRGIRLARRITSLLDPRAESPMESYLRALLIAGGLVGMAVNPNLYDECGTFLARVDLLFRKQRSSSSLTGITTAPTGGNSPPTLRDLRCFSGTATSCCALPQCTSFSSKSGCSTPSGGL